MEATMPHATTTPTADDTIDSLAARIREARAAEARAGAPRRYLYSPEMAAMLLIAARNAGGLPRAAQTEER
jgi:hypothetical protein